MSVNYARFGPGSSALAGTAGEMAETAPHTAPWRPTPLQHDVRTAAFDALPLPALVLDALGRVISWNQAALAFIRTSPAALDGEPWWRLLSPHGGSAPTSIAQHDRPAQGTRRRFVLRAGDGDRPVLVQTRQVEAGGAADCALLLLEEDWQGDERRAPTTDSLLLDMAHELRSPLFSFSVALAGLADGPAAPVEAGQRRLVGALQRSAVHLQALVENALDAARLHTRTFTVAAVESDLAEIVAEAALVVAPLLDLRGQRVDLQLPTGQIPVYADTQRIRQVLVNLLHNASKYGPPDDTIIVRAQRGGANMVVEVVDHGAGIPADEQARIFQRGFRGRAASGSGSGLGLAICRAIVEAHGGAIGVSTTPGHGATLWFSLRAA